MIGPDKQVMLSHRRLLHESFEFVAPLSGEYAIVISNVKDQAPKHVSLAVANPSQSHWLPPTGAESEFQTFPANYDDEEYLVQWLGLITAQTQLVKQAAQEGEHRKLTSYRQS